MVVAGLSLAACTHSDTMGQGVPTTPTGAAAISLAPDAQRYAAIVAPVDAAVDTFASRSGALPLGASVDDFVSIAGPFATTIEEVDNELRQVRWPVVVRHEIKTELAANQALIADLVGTTDVTLILALWRQQIIAAANRASNTKRIVSIDLGLFPPAPG